MTDALNPEPLLRALHFVAGIDRVRGSCTERPQRQARRPPLRVCGLDDLVAMKRAAGRPRDLDDLQRLGAV